MREWVLLSRTIELLHVPNVGKGAAETIGTTHWNLVDIARKSERDLQSLGLPAKAITGIVHFMKLSNNDKLLEDTERQLKEFGLHWTQERARIEKQAGKLAGKTFVVTGTIPNFTRDDITALIEENDGKVSNSLSRQTNYLIAGEGGGTKREKAEEYGVPSIDIDGLYLLLGGNRK